MIRVLIYLYLIYVSAADELRRLPCKAPKYGSMKILENNKVMFECDDGFFLLGPSEAECNMSANELIGVKSIGCIPIFKGNASCGDRCPKDLKYLLDIYIGEPTEDQNERGATVMGWWEADKRSKGSTTAMSCDRICKLGPDACFTPSLNKRNRAKIRCLRCIYKRGCGNTFWG
ncbi:uncharacterized protein LOC120330045 [Styela clava]|uniref:uncharacterized protein LOC120330045 n=1 Tax=Styela clava TaxID=7725 RepID=UPI00193ABC2C|nr:uncharacterized protein LOC120330045 [Styela clava]